MRTRASIAAPLLVLVLAAAARAAEPLDAATRDFDQVHLELFINPEIERREVTGRLDLTFRSLRDGLERLRLHSRETKVRYVKDGEGRFLEFDHQDGILSVRLAEPLAKGAEAKVSMEYLSRPTRGLYFHFPTERHPEIPLSFYSQGQGTDNRHWIPCYDLPDDRFTLDLLVEVPDEIQTVGNGLKVREYYLPGPRRRDRWVMQQRLPSYLISIAAGPYESWVEERDGIVLETNAFKGRLEEAKLAFGRAGDMIEFFSEYIGVPYPYPRYAQTVVWDFVYGGMENTTATTMNLRLLHGPEVRPVFTADGIVAHELAHQWFGDLLSYRSGEHVWLNEGFASYMADLFFESAEGEDEFRYRRWTQNRSYFETTPDPAKLDLSPDPRGDRPLELFGGKQYSRGAAILHLLRWEIGDDAFRRGVLRYVSRHADSAVVTEDLRRAMEAEAGCDLAWFFNQWVYGAGYPIVHVGCEYDAERQDVVVRVRQEGPPYRFSLPLRIESATRSQPVRLPVRLEEHEFRVASPEPPSWVRVNDGEQLLARIEVEQSFDAWAAQADQDPDAVGRIVALHALEKHGEDGAHLIARALGADMFWAVRVEAARSLSRMSASRAALTGLLHAASDEDARVREAALLALGDRSRDEAGDAVVAALRAEEHPYVIAAAARALGRLHAEGAFEILARLLLRDSHREVVRHGALDGLRALGDERAVDLAIPLLEHRFGRGAMSMMRKAALALVLALEPDAPRTREIVFGLLDDPYFRMRSWAAEECGRFRFPGAADRLRRMKDHDRDAGVRWTAGRVLAEIEKPDR